MRTDFEPLLVLLSFCLAACASSSTNEADTDDAGDAPVDSSPETVDDPLYDDTSIDGPVEPDEPLPCSCAPGIHDDRIFVISDDGQLWTYDPEENTFELFMDSPCGSGFHPFSMAVDADGVAWILSSDTERIYLLDLNEPVDCVDSGYSPDGTFGLFGMAFTSESDTSLCSELFVLSYRGTGPFIEGEDVGTLGEMDMTSLGLSTVGSIDFDGGELAGTRDGRLFAFVGVTPAKLVEYDKTTALEIENVPLSGMSKTSASAFSFFGGDIWFFTEAPPSDCIPCLESTCPTHYATCIADPTCEEQLECAMYQGEVSDECGGLMPAELQTCMFVDCVSACDVATHMRVSRVTRMDWDESEGPGRTLTVLEPDAPVRIVGAGTSPCVPEIPH